MRLVVGTRGSPLALIQTRWAVERLRMRFPGTDVVLRAIRTQGDARPDAPLASMPRGLFAKELEMALERGEIDLAVHSFKDLPAILAPGFAVAAITEREDPRDALVAPRYRGLDDLPEGATLGTSSPRRAAQLRARRPDLRVVPVRGNVGTRVAKAEGPGLDGVVLAAAGLHRLGLHARITQYLDPEVCIPEAGQGALAIETRAGDRTAQEIAQAADHGETRAAVTAEVTVVRALGGGCTVPIAAFAQVGGGVIRLRAMVADADGRRVVRAEATGPAGDPEAVGRTAAERLRALGAGELLSGGSPRKGAP